MARFDKLLSGHSKRSRFSVIKRESRGDRVKTKTQCGPDRGGSVSEPHLSTRIFHDAPVATSRSLGDNVRQRRQDLDDPRASIQPPLSASTVKLPWSKRMRHVTWAYFTVTMATGGIANVLHAVPFRFNGLYEIGLAFFILNIFLYILIWAMILTRFFLYPSSFKESFTHPTESLFIAAFAVSFGTILITVDEYGANHTGPWLNEAIFVLFWFDAALAVFLSLATYMILWSTQTFTIAQMTPIWIFPAYPLLIVGPHAAQLSSKLTSSLRAIQVIVGGFTIQGIGYLVSLTIYSAFVYRLMTHKLPSERLRPGMFISVGPSAFTASSSIGMAQNLESTVATWNYFMDVPGPLAAQILRLAASWMSLWLWGAAVWFFFIALVSNMQCFRREHHVPFAMTWFSFVFPQTALCTSTFAIAEAFKLFPLQIVGCVMTALLVLVYLFVLFMMVRAIFRHDILWPEKGEDKEEGGFKRTVSLSLPPDVEEAISRIENKDKPRTSSKDAYQDSRERDAIYQDMANGDGEADYRDRSPADISGTTTRT